ncbi:trypsin-like peptidase domain-containing protein [Streptomyces sp. NPDC048420]|uniref:trypsin-like peptidase domain-containing protein n=1 Tax=Streptomyces sp. NPDC048420 TaxID=3155755 RepID=UPI003445421A
MTVAGYWVELYQDRQRLGGGFLVTRRFVVTALHCLRAMTAFDTDLDIVLADGSCVVGQVYGQAKDADLALIEISADSEVFQPVPVAGVARGGDRWRGPYRPAENEVELSGHIDSGAIRYDCEGGASIEALQLTADQRLGDYSGYSGGPVEGVAQGRRPAVVGILLEQALDRADASRSANVLFAATIGEVLRRFDVFDVAHLVDVLRPARREETRAQSRSTASSSPRSQVDRVDSVIHFFHQLSGQGVMDPVYVNELRYLALRRIFEEEPNGGAAWPTPREAI